MAVLVAQETDSSTLTDPSAPRVSDPTTRAERDGVMRVVARRAARERPPRVRGVEWGPYPPALVISVGAFDCFARRACLAVPRAAAGEVAKGPLHRRSQPGHTAAPRTAM